MPPSARQFDRGSMSLRTQKEITMSQKHCMKTKLFFGALLIGMVALMGCEPQGVADEAKSIWLTDYKKALETAHTENKAVLMDFTGSDWCIWCKILKKEVFNTPQFAQYAKTNLILLEIDFPNGKPQSDELRKQNAELQQRFGIEGFPTILILNSEGKPLGKTGYIPGGPQPFIREIEAIRTKQ